MNGKTVLPLFVVVFLFFFCVILSHFNNNIPNTIQLNGFFFSPPSIFFHSVSHLTVYMWKVTQFLIKTLKTFHFCCCCLLFLIFSFICKRKIVVHNMEIITYITQQTGTIERRCLYITYYVLFIFPLVVVWSMNEVEKEFHSYQLKTEKKML